MCFSRETGCFSCSSSSRSCPIQAWSARVPHATCTTTHDPLADIKVPHFGDQLTRVWLAGAKDLHAGSHITQDNLHYLYPFRIVDWHTKRTFIKQKKLNSVVNQNIIIGKPEHNVAQWNIFIICFTKMCNSVIISYHSKTIPISWLNFSWVFHFLNYFFSDEGDLACLPNSLS